MHKKDIQIDVGFSRSHTGRSALRASSAPEVYAHCPILMRYAAPLRARGPSDQVTRVAAGAEKLLA